MSEDKGEEEEVGGRVHCPGGNPQLLPANPEGFLEKGACGELESWGCGVEEGRNSQAALSILSGGFAGIYSLFG